MLEFVQHGTVWDAFLERPAFALEAQTILAQIASALNYVHNKDLAHCDVKPDNILVSHPPDSKGSGMLVKLTDFGLARSSMATPRRLGRPYPFVAPELFLPSLFENLQVGSLPDDRLDFRHTDKWALGVSLLWCLKMMPMKQFTDMEDGVDLRNPKEAFQDFIEASVEVAERCEVLGVGEMVKLNPASRQF